MFVVTDGAETCLNINDALHSKPASVKRYFVRMLNELVPSLDYVFCSYGTASHFPNCYVFPARTQLRRHTATAILQSILGRDYQCLIAPVCFSVAADVVLLGED